MSIRHHCAFAGALTAAVCFTVSAAETTPPVPLPPQAEVPADGATSGILFEDGFESGDMSKTNADGFRWLNNNRTAVVTADRVVWNNGAKDSSAPEGSDWRPKNGSHCLRFHYPAGEAWSEQRFYLGNVAHPEIWIRYWLRVPTNYQHGDQSPSNNKFFALWMDDYSNKGDGVTVVWNFWRQKDGNSRFTFSISQDALGSGHHAGHEDFLVSERDRGRWMQIVLYAKRASAPDVHDGQARIWRRWEGEDTFQLISETIARGLHVPQDPSKPQGWANGYILGWANAAYAEATDWLLDDFTVATTSLIEEKVSQ